MFSLVEIGETELKITGYDFKGTAQFAFLPGGELYRRITTSEIAGRFICEVDAYNTSATEIKIETLYLNGQNILNALKKSQLWRIENEILNHIADNFDWYVAQEDYDEIGIKRRKK